MSKNDLKKRKIHLAGKYGTREKLLEVAKAITWQGHSITSSWLSGNGSQDWESIAETDRHDIDRCDLLIAFVDDFSDVSQGNSRFWEQGYAHGIGKTVWLVGNVPQLVFHWLPEMVHLPDVNSVLARLGQSK